MPIRAFAVSAFLYNPAPNAIYDTTGAIARGAKAFFYSAGTTSPLTVYRDAALTTPWTYPIVAGINGVFQPIYIPYVDYRVKITTSANATIYDADNIANPPPPDAGGGGGITVSQNMVVNTGYMIATLTSGALDGYVRMNGRTIGSASSSATERANDDAEALFKYLWNNLDDSLAPVGGGRGASANADWAANKIIGVPSMQGRVPVGVDDMGTTAANVLQRSTTATATNGSPTLTVASASGLARTMYAIIDGVATGQITAISGTTVTLSANYAGTTGGGKSVRFSIFPDAQLAGGFGGSQTAIMTVAELAFHDHGVTDPQHRHTTPAGVAGTQVGSITTTDAGIVGTFLSGFSATGITINNNGQSLPSSLIQPSRLVTYYMKL